MHHIWWSGPNFAKVDLIAELIKLCVRRHHVNLPQYYDDEVDVLVDFLCA